MMEIKTIKTIRIAIFSFLLALSTLSRTAISSPTIELVDTTNTATAGSSKLIKIKVTSSVALASDGVRMFYLKGGDPAFQSLKMYDDGLHDDGAKDDGIWANKIPLSKVSVSGTAYYLKATDTVGDYVVMPPGADFDNNNATVLTVTGNITGPEYDDATHGDPKPYDVSFTASDVPAWKSETDWTMISFPFILPNNDPEAIFSSWGKAEDDWQLYQYNGGDTYDRAVAITASNIAKFSSMERGKAAWIWTPAAKKIAVTGATGGDPKKVYAIKLNSGWNQIGNPFRFTRYWDNGIKVGLTNNIKDAVPILTAAVQGLVANPPLIYLRSGSIYKKISADITTIGLNVVPFPGTLEPWQGYWILAKKDVWLFIDPLSDGPTFQPPAIGPAYKSKLFEVKPASGTWMVELKANGVPIVAGMAPNASNLEDAMDIPNPPLVPGVDAIRFNFPHLGWDDKHVSSYEQDIRKLDKSAIWNISLKSEQPKTIKLTWKQLYSLPKGYELFLVDEAADKTIDLGIGRESSYILKNFSGSRKFYLIASFKGAGIPDSLARAIVTKTELGQNFPNPFNPETWIPFKLAEESPVVLKIYSSSGKLIRRTYLGRMPVGIYTSKDKAIYWDGKNDMGESVSSGVYFYQLEAGNRRLTKKMIVRK